jgi:hypothetical protein
LKGGGRLWAKIKRIEKLLAQQINAFHSSEVLVTNPSVAT